jgi:magnesium-transporting ATPase (P-type)
MTRPVNQDFHACTVQDALEAWLTRPEGLDADDAATRLAQHGPNLLPEPPRQSPVLGFLRHFHNILIYVLLASTVITAALGHMIDTGVILAVVLAIAVIGFILADEELAMAEAMMACLNHEKGS